jgi:hypothetical protein
VKRDSGLFGGSYSLSQQLHGLILIRGPRLSRYREGFRPRYSQMGESVDGKTEVAIRPTPVHAVETALCWKCTQNLSARASQSRSIPGWYQETKMDVKSLLTNTKSDFMLACYHTRTSPISVHPAQLPAYPVGRDGVSCIAKRRVGSTMVNG